MKTTIEIPDALAEQARDVARAEGATLRELVVAGLRREVERRTAAERVDFHFPTAGGHGLAPDLPPGAAIERSYDAPA